MVVAADESGFVRPGGGRMRWVSEDRRTLFDASGAPYPVRRLARRLADTVIRSTALAGTLALIGLLWEALH